MRPRIFRSASNSEQTEASNLNRPSHLRDNSRARRKKALQRKAAHVMFGSRAWVHRHVRRFAAEVHEQRILELGSGRQDLGVDAYSVKFAFDQSNDFIQSDVVPEYGHEIIDVTAMEFEEEFDVILCLNVLEHLFDFDAAVKRIHQALKQGGKAVIVVPVFYPYHDEPFDFWRFTEHALRRMLDRFTSVEVHHRGLRQLPFAYFVIATK